MFIASFATDVLDRKPQLPRLNYTIHLLPPANEVCGGYVFTGVCHSVHRGGGMRGCTGGGFIRGACVVLFGGACVVFSVFLDTVRYCQ